VLAILNIASHFIQGLVWTAILFFFFFLAVLGFELRS
jgi:hypothetical protein